MKAKKFFYNNLPELNWIPIGVWKESQFSHEASYLIVVAYADDYGINVTYGWSYPNNDYTAFSHCIAGRLNGERIRVKDDCLIALNPLCG
jgi:hypothetical protein